MLWIWSFVFVHTENVAIVIYPRTYTQTHKHTHTHTHTHTGFYQVYDAIGRYPAAISFLERAGFSRTDGGAVLTYGRNDPGLLWLAGGILDESAASLGV